MSKRLIVSMTSYPKRIAMAFDMIKKLENQTKKPDKVVLYLSKDEFPGCAFAEDVKPYAGELDFEIHWVEGNMKPHKKYYYAFQEYRDDYIITMDDDIIYAEDTIECFMRAAKKFPHTVLSMRTHLITRDVDGNIEAYDHWAQKCYEYVNEPRMDLIAVGAGGCLYEPSLFDDEIFEKSIVLNLCEGKSFLQYINDAFDWSDRHINMIHGREVREQLWSEYEAEKIVWGDFQRNLGYVHNLEEMTIAAYMQEFSMVSKEAEPKEDNVQFLTIHASKGKEFDNVIIIGMVNDELPSYQSLKKGLDSIELEEERRNCFVAITRTKKRLFMTYSEKYFGWSKKMSQFLVEMCQ